jgi:hypothetical protein
MYSVRPWAGLEMHREMARAVAEIVRMANKLGAFLDRVPWFARRAPS